MLTPPSPTLATHLAEARAAWPTLAWNVEEYTAWLVATGGPELDAMLSRSVAGDVVLCWAVGQGDPEAHRLFETNFMTLVPPALRQFAESSAFVDEVAQRLRIKLLVRRQGAEPGLAASVLGGNLTGLLRVAAVREAITVRNQGKRDLPVEEIAAMPGEQDPELRHLKAKYAGEFERAFVTAVAELAAPDRHILRLNLSLGASIDDIARIYQVHRATAARRLNAAREDLAARTRQHLGQRLGLEEHELTSLLRLVRTEASRLLNSIPPDAE